LLRLMFAPRHRMDRTEPDPEWHYSDLKRPIARSRETVHLGGDIPTCPPPLNGDEIPKTISDGGSLRVTKCRLSPTCTRLPLVAVPMVHVRVVGVDMAHRPMAMPMGMRLRHGAIVLMLVMLIVDVAVLMLQWLVLVLVRMPLRQMQPKADAH